MTEEQKLRYLRKRNEIQGTDALKDIIRQELKQYEGTMSYRWYLIESGQYKPTAEEQESDRKRWAEANHREAEEVRRGKWSTRGQMYRFNEHDE